MDKLQQQDKTWEKKVSNKTVTWLAAAANLGSSSGMFKFMPTARSEFRWRVDGSVCKISFVTSENKKLECYIAVRRNGSPEKNGLAYWVHL